MATAILCILLVAAAVIGLKSYLKRLTSGCCGAAGAPGVKKIWVKDRNASHYPFKAVLKVDGMSCGNCAAHVESALNALEGVWAQVDLAEGEALVRMKERRRPEELKAAVKAAGYTVYRVEEDA